jgi:hypothetical protein
MDPTQPLPADLLRTALAVVLRGIDVPHWVAAHQVTTIASGLYRSPDLATPVRTGDLRQEMYHACMDQGPGQDAAFVVIAATEIAAAADRDYREAQLAAGLVEGRLHLVALRPRRGSVRDDVRRRAHPASTWPAKHARAPVHLYRSTRIQVETRGSPRRPQRRPDGDAAVLTSLDLATAG